MWKNNDIDAAGAHVKLFQVYSWRQGNTPTAHYAKHAHRLARTSGNVKVRAKHFVLGQEDFTSHPPLSDNHVVGVVSVPTICYCFILPPFCPLSPPLLSEIFPQLSTFLPSKATLRVTARHHRPPLSACRLRHHNEKDRQRSIKKTDGTNGTHGSRPTRLHSGPLFFGPRPAVSVCSDGSVGVCLHFIVEQHQQIFVPSLSVSISLVVVS